MAAAIAAAVLLTAGLPAAAASVATTISRYPYLVGFGLSSVESASIDLYANQQLAVVGVPRFTLPPGTPPSTVPTGTISVYDGTTLLATQPLAYSLVSWCGALPCAAWQADIVLPSLSPGVHLITVHYSGDATFLASTSTAITAKVVAPPPPMPIPTTISRYPYIAGFGLSSVESASIDLYANQQLAVVGVPRFTLPPGTPPSTVPTGTISVYDGTTLLATQPLAYSLVSWCGALPCAAWQADLVLPPLSIGTHVITVHYSGDATFLPNRSTVIATNESHHRQPGRQRSPRRRCGPRTLDRPRRRRRPRCGCRLARSRPCRG